jgi:hypothetical protein
MIIFLLDRSRPNVPLKRTKTNQVNKQTIHFFSIKQVDQDTFHLVSRTVLCDNLSGAKCEFLQFSIDLFNHPIQSHPPLGNDHTASYASYTNGLTASYTNGLTASCTNDLTASYTNLTVIRH